MLAMQRLVYIDSFSRGIEWADSALESANVVSYAGVSYVLSHFIGVKPDGWTIARRVRYFHLGYSLNAQYFLEHFSVIFASFFGLNRSDKIVNETDFFLQSKFSL